ncbi:MAG: flavin-containing monooxygenase [Pseudomarimonas sp.]
MDPDSVSTDPATTEITLVDIAIIGAGFGGLAMARALLREGRTDFRVFEKADEVGGTWRDNSYPGAACDVPSHLYSLSDAPNPNWSRLFPQQPEIQVYLQTLAAPIRNAGLLLCGWTLASAEWDGEAGVWQLQSTTGQRVRARVLIAAMGGLHVPAWPDLAGREDFLGQSWHSARWPSGTDLAGKRVGVIGTGASAVQLVPKLAVQAAELHVFQRTPAWVMPRPDVAISRFWQRAFAAFPALRLMLRGGIFLWLELVASALLRPRLAGWARWLARRHLHQQVADPDLRARLTPTYPLGCKRVLVSSDYYPALQRPNVQLCDAAIKQIEPDGVKLNDGRRVALDVLIYASGFRPMAILEGVEITGEDGRRLADEWRERPQAHLGISVTGYPNLFFLLGPNTALGHNSVLTMIESQVRHVLLLLEQMKRRGAMSVSPTPAAQHDFIHGIDQSFVGTAWAGGCHSWYLNQRGQNIALWIGSSLSYRWRTRRLRRGEYFFR